MGQRNFFGGWGLALPFWFLEAFAAHPQGLVWARGSATSRGDPGLILPRKSAQTLPGSPEWALASGPWCVKFGLPALLASVLLWLDRVPTAQALSPSALPTGQVLPRPEGVEVLSLRPLDWQRLVKLAGTRLEAGLPAAAVPLPSAPLGQAVVLQPNAISTLQQEGTLLWLAGLPAETLDVQRASLQVGQTLVRAELGALPRLEAQGGPIRIPWELFQVQAAGSIVSVGRPVLVPERDHLGYDPDRGLFTVNVRFGLVTASGSAERLAAPIEFLFQTSASSIRPVSLQLAQNNTYQALELADGGADGAVTLAVAPLAGLGGHEAPAIRLPIQRPVLQIAVSPMRMPGFGLGTAEITITSDLERVPSGLPLTLVAERGRIEPAQLQLGSQGFARAVLRSTGLGQEHITALASGFQTAQASLEYRLPWSFFMAAFLGGIAGAVASAFLNQRPHPPLRRLLVAGIAGLVGSVAYTAGVNLFGIDFGSGAHEALVFTLAALVALIGLPALSTLSAPATREP